MVQKTISMVSKRIFLFPKVTPPIETPTPQAKTTPPSLIPLTS